MKLLLLIVVAIVAVMTFGMIVGEAGSALEQKKLQHNCHQDNAAWVCLDGFKL